MKKLPKFELHQLVPWGLALSALGFGLLHTDELMNIGAILLPLGLLPAVLLLSKYKD
ncbi:MAG: hypothetical protein RL406_830 [Pseudomonadota bacterium]|jgi:hypothetical protein